MRKNKELTHEQYIERANKRCDKLLRIMTISLVIFSISCIFKEFLSNQIAEIICYLTAFIFIPSLFAGKYYDTVLHQDLLRREEEFWLKERQKNDQEN